MKILCTNREFKVAINNSHLLEYKHRITNLSAINKLNIYYDLTLSKVHMETLPWDRSPDPSPNPSQNEGLGEGGSICLQGIVN